MSEFEFAYNTGAAWTDLLGTRRLAYASAPIERLSGPGRLAEWFAAVGLAPDRAPDDDDVTLAIAAREAMRLVACDSLGLRPAPDAPNADAAAATLAGLGDTGSTALVIGADGTLRPQVPATTRAALARLLTSAVADLGHHPDDFGVCADAECSKIFFDPSHVRKSCCDTCSTRLRVRAHREKSRAT